MKLFTIIDVHKYDIEDQGNGDWDGYMCNMSQDIKILHSQAGIPFNEACEEELCMWCNFKAAVRDACIPDGHLDCELTNYSIGCKECIKGISWFKRLI